MDDAETSSQAGLVRNISPAEEGTDQLTLKERTAKALKSKKFHNSVFILIVIDCIIVIIELCFTLLTECTPHREDAIDRPPWLQVLLYISMGISCVFLLELPPSLWALGLEYYNPWSDVPHSAFHLFDALIIIFNFTILFLQGPAQELVGLLIILRLWRLIKLLGGVASGVETVNSNLQYRLDHCEKELASKSQELEDANRRLETLQRKLDAMQP